MHEGQGTRGTILSDWEVWCILTTGGCLHGADIHSPAQIANPGQGEPYTMPPGPVGQVVNQERRVLDRHPTGGPCKIPILSPSPIIEELWSR